MQITSGRIQEAQKIIIYGPEGIGKSTLANQFPKPVFIDTENGTGWMDIKRIKCKSWQDVLDAIKYLKTEKHDFKTVIIDTADWAERFCVQFLCKNSNKSSIEDFGYGKGYTFLAEEFGRMLISLNTLGESGMHVVFIAHTTVKKMELPDEAGSYDRYEFKLTRQTSPLLKEWGGCVLFVNYHVIVRQDDNKRSKAIGGRKRIIHTQHTAAYDAKNRSDLPDQIPFELPFDFKLIEKILGDATVANTGAAATPPESLVGKLATALAGVTGDANGWLVDKAWVKSGQTFRDLPEVKMKEILDRLQNFKVVIKKHKKEKANVK